MLKTLLIFIILSNYSFGQSIPIKDIKGIDSFCVKFMETFKQGKFSNAILLLKIYSVMDTSQINQLSSTVERQMKILGSSYGRFLSYEFIFDKKVKDLVLKRTYLMLLEKAYLRFDFTFYKLVSSWFIVNFNYSENIDDLFK